ncbi:hypothetical protein FE257_009004 [Aspergillus nanangensis]|uniref:Uncharacterized protein n=1 Tax=Aspergillus nanangensis TaxID=2582783 RepID=A0AAD4CYH0_ASPNN|nr:hypothetical protein FE257_009004 [Aspergillus nanangensis]
MKSSLTKVPNGHGSLYKEVRFSPTATPVRRTQSVPGSTHRAQMLGTKGDSATLSASYIQQAQALLDRQRVLLETERTIFAEERELWVHERQILLARIYELESLSKNQGSSRHTCSSEQAVSQMDTVVQKRSITFQLPFRHPRETGSPDQSPQNSTSAQVWEGSSPGSRPTRVFPDSETPDPKSQQQSSIAEQGGGPGFGHLTVSAPSLDAALSPKSRAADSAANASISVPIEKLDSRLDGINLKSSALPPEIVARVMTPPSPSSREPSPASSSHKFPCDRRCSLKLKLSELGPPENNLVRDAGHTPMVLIDRDVDTEHPSPKEDPSVEDDDPLTPDTAPRQPAENSDSYFSDLPEDPALKGPLSLLNEEEHDTGFLNELNQKLLDEARQAVGRSGAPDPQEEAMADPPPPQGEQEPEIKFKNTTNFGTAFGTEIR